MLTRHNNTHGNKEATETMTTAKVGKRQKNECGSQAHAQIYLLYLCSLQRWLFIYCTYVLYSVFYLLYMCSLQRWLFICCTCVLYSGDYLLFTCFLYSADYLPAVPVFSTMGLLFCCTCVLYSSVYLTFIPVFYATVAICSSQFQLTSYCLPVNKWPMWNVVNVFHWTCMLDIGWELHSIMALWLLHTIKIDFVGKIFVQRRNQRHEINRWR